MKNKKYEIQSIPEYIPQTQAVPGINTPKINSETSIYNPGQTSSRFARMYSGSAKLVQATIVKIDLDNADFSSGVTTDTTNGKIIIQTSGYYEIIAQITWDTTAAGKNYNTYIFKNGSSIKQAIFQASNAYSLAASVQDIFFMSAGDELELKCYQDSGGNAYTIGGIGATSLAIFSI